MKKTNTILDQIIETKIEEMTLSKKKVSLEDIRNAISQRKTPIRDFARALQKVDSVSLIAEIKKASPSKGVIKQAFDHVAIVKLYDESGVVGAISVLTDEKYFQGKLSYIKDVKAVTTVPILRKDFIIDEYQIYESYRAEADALLLIAAALEKEQLGYLLSVAEGLGLSCLVEVHNADELKTALDVQASIIGVNARDLKTFTIDNDLFSSLVSSIPEGIIKVAESGIETREDVVSAYANGADAILVGSSIMRSENIQGKLQELTGGTYAY